MNNNKNIEEDLYNLYYTKNIPNIIFHGENLTGKKTLLEKLLKHIYKTNENINKYVLEINCSHGKGNIKFIRDNLKYFGNSIVFNKNESLFKSIILVNADKLTIDAQSALRRCIEIYNHSTRFFIIVDNKNLILKPILSRFSEIYCPNKINITYKFNKNFDFDCKKYYSLNNFINLDESYNIVNNNESYNESYNVVNNNENYNESYNIVNNNKKINLYELTHKLYNNSFSGNILINFIKNKLPENLNKYKFLSFIDTYKKELRDEKLIILFCLNFIYFRNINDLENISFI